MADNKNPLKDQALVNEGAGLLMQIIQSLQKRSSEGEAKAAGQSWINQNAPNLLSAQMYGDKWNLANKSGFNTSDDGLMALIDGFLYRETDFDQQAQLRSDLLKWMQTLNDRDFNFAQKLEERSYNESLRDEQRVYDSPVAQLQRLMATGMSRQASLQMINQSGSGGSSGIASPSVVGSTSPGFATDYNAPGGTTFNNYTQGVSQIVSSICQLFNAGVNGYEAIKQGNLQQQQTIALQRVNDAQSVGSQFNSVYQTAVDNGLIDTSSIRSFDDARKAVRGIPYESSPDIYEYAHGDGYEQLTKTPLALSQAASEFDFNNRASESVPRLLQARALAESYALYPDQILNSIDKNDADIAKIYTDIGLAHDTFELDKQRAESEMNLQDAQAEVSRSERRQKDLENERIKIALHREQITADDLDQTALYEASFKLQMATQLNDKKVMDDVIASIINDEKQRRAIMAFNVLRLQNLETMLNQPNGNALLNWSTFYNDLGVGQMFNSWMQSVNQSDLGAAQRNFESFVMSFGIQPKRAVVGGAANSGPVGANLFGVQQ